MKLLPKFQPGGIIRRSGDPYEYTKTKDGGYSYRKKGSNDSWTIASGSAASSISKLFDKSPTFSNTPATNSQGVSLMIAKPDENRHSMYNTLLASKPKVYDMNAIINSNNEYQINKIKARQQDLKDNGYNIAVDGIWGKKSQAAADAFALKNKTKSKVLPNPTVTKPETALSNLIPEPIKHPINYLGSKLRDVVSSSSSRIAGQAAPFVADIVGVTAPMTEKSFTPGELEIFRKIKANPNNPNIGDFRTKNSKGETIIIPANKRRENTEAHFMYYAQHGTPEEKVAANSLLNKIGQGTVKNIGTSEPVDYYNFNESVNDQYAGNEMKELKRRPNEDDTSYLKRIGTRVIGPKFGTVGTAENDKVGQPVILASIKKGGLIPRRK